MTRSVVRRLVPATSEGRGALGLAAVLALSLALKLTVWLHVLPVPERFQDPDSALYDASARSLLRLGAFTTSPDLPDVAETRRTPGYPLFLAGGYAVLGEGSPGVLLLQVLVSLGTIALVYRLACRLWSTAVGVGAASLLAVDVASLASSVKLMSDTLLAFLVTAALAAGVTLLTGTRKTLPAVALGVLLTLAVFVRPVAYYLVVPVALGVVAVAAKERWGRRTTAAVLAAILGPFLLGIGAWQARNAVLTGSPQFSAFEGFNLLYYRGAGVVALRDGVSLAEARASLGLELGHRELALESGWTPEQDREWKGEALRLITHHPLLFLRSQLPGAFRLMLAPGEGGLLRMLGRPTGRLADAAGYLRRFGTPLGALSSAWALLYLAVLYAGVLAWGWVLVPGVGSARTSARSSLQDGRPRHGIRPVDLFLWGVLLYFLVVSAGQGDSRFRLPMMPILVLYSARGLLQAGSRVAHRTPAHQARRRNPA